MPLPPAPAPASGGPLNPVPNNSASWGITLSGYYVGLMIQGLTAHYGESFPRTDESLRTLRKRLFDIAEVHAAEHTARYGQTWNP